MTNLTPISIGS